MSGRASFAALLLAAGHGSRMGGGKLLLTREGATMAEHAAKTLLAAGAESVTALLPPGGEELRRRLETLGVVLVENPDRDEGLASSIRAGVRSLGEREGYVAVALADMPHLAPETVRELARRAEESGRGIVLPLHQGRRGHPVFFDLARYREALLALTGDRGARGLVAANPADVLEVETADAGTVTDIDTPDDAARHGWRP